ncbi:MAG: SUMF1/EgtB/PvdO family nonheme iron enzyme [Elusimicrobia bacterium]|nr:SUMF1/EgtB/PvdO family nonheme iron enzyme [Elusimicrobiota bacterium]
MDDARREVLFKQAKKLLVLALQYEPGLEPEAKREAMEDFVGEGLDEVFASIPAGRFAGDGAVAELPLQELCGLAESAYVATPESFKRHLSGKPFPSGLRSLEGPLRHLARAGQITGDLRGDLIQISLAVISEVREWTQDWYHDSCNGAPSDGSAWENPMGSLRVNRGGSWCDDAADLGTTIRGRDVPGIRVDYLGFRPAR